MNPESKNDSRNNEKCSLITISASELSAITKRIDQLEKSNKRIDQLEEFVEKQQGTIEKQQGRIIMLERELNNLNGNKAVGSTLKRKRTDEDQDQVHDDDMESKPPASPSAGKTTNTNNNNDEEAVVIPQCDNEASFKSLPDDLLHKIAEFDGNCYSKFASIEKRCRNIYDVEAYQLKKQTYVYGCGTVDMILQRYLQDRKNGELCLIAKVLIVKAVIRYNRLDVFDWITQLGDVEFLKCLCINAAHQGRIDILTRVFSNSNLTMLDEILDRTSILCDNAALGGKLETLKCLRKHGAKWGAGTIASAEDKGHDEVVQYLRAESSGSEQVGSDDEDVQWYL